MCNAVKRAVGQLRFEPVAHPTTRGIGQYRHAHVGSCSSRQHHWNATELPCTHPKQLLTRLLLLVQLWVSDCPSIHHQHLPHKLLVTNSFGRSCHSEHRSHSFKLQPPSPADTRRVESDLPQFWQNCRKLSSASLTAFSGPQNSRKEMTGRD